MNKIGILITIFVVGFLLLLLYSTLHGPRYRVEVCMSFKGNSACKTVNAKSKQAALRSATENACADISSGVTDTVECQNTPPQSIHWLQRP